MGKKSITVIISIVIIFISLLYIFFILTKNRKLYTTSFNPKLYEKKFNQSQWVIPESKNVISDEDLYAYSGYKYIQGLNPILISPEVPPLGKYIIGGSILAFQNQRIASVIAAVLSLVVIAYVVYFFSESVLATSIAVALTVFNTLFIDQIIHAPQLDIFQLLFIILFLLFFLKYQKSKSPFFLLLAGLSAGSFLSIKFFVINYLLINTILLLFYFFKKLAIKKILFEMIIFNIISLATFIFTYGIYFLQGGSLRSFLGVQKWIFLFYNSSQIDKIRLLGSYINLIFFNRWRFWSEGYPIIHYQYWSFLWPLVFIFGIFSGFLLLKARQKVKNDLVLFLTSFVFCYNIILFITPIFPRYLLLLFIPLNILIALYFGPKIEGKFKIQKLKGKIKT